MDLIVRSLSPASPAMQPIEVVERKGLGHPDTLCDAVAEQISVDLCRYYLDRFGVILHHNVDKVLLCGGSARVSFGDGEILEPIEIYLGGRATQRYRGEDIPVHEIACDACRQVLRARVRRLNVDRDVRIISRLRPGSGDLAALFARADRVPLSNDTSIGVGFSPYTELEQAVLEVERRLNHADTRRAHPEIGEDVKVMGVRRGTRIDLTIGCAFVARYVRDIDDYVEKKSDALRMALDAAHRVTQLEIDGRMNAADDVEQGNVFLTATGTSAEAGDDGEVGRGNRISGLITPYRAMTLEAAAGKNPVNHCGKLYSLAATRVAAEITRTVASVTDATCVLVSQIGRAISDPQVVDVRIASDGVVGTGAAHACVEEVVRAELARLPELCARLIAGQVELF